MRITSILLLIALPIILSGQSPTFLPVEFNKSQSSISGLRMACDNFAGTFRLGNSAPTNKSTATSDRKHIYLCKNDSVSIIHNGDYNLSGDPKPATLPGIGYIMYQLTPTGPTGPSLSNIQTNNNSLFTQPSTGGAFSNQTSGLWMVTDKINGNLTFYNQGQLQASFSPGGGAVSYWFAPATLDDFSGKKFETATGSTVAGACVNVNITEAIRVTYLNPVIIEEVAKNCVINNCVSRIVIKGGLPEFNGSVYTKISIINKNDPNIKGKIISTNLYKHNDTLEIFVPTPGEYIITATDEYSCDGNITLDIASCPSTTFMLPKQNAKFGDEICIPVTATKVTDAVSLTLGVTWDNTILKFKSLNTNNTKLTGIGTSDISYSPISNDIKISYFKSGGAPFSLNDGDLLFSVCLEVIGSNGKSSPLTFINLGTAPSPLEDDCGKPMGFQYSNGQVNVTDEILFVNVKVDSIPCQNVGNNTGGFEVTVTGGTAPYKVNWLNKDDNTTGFTNINGLDGKTIITGLKAGNYLLTITDSAPTPNSPSPKEYEIPAAKDFVVQLDIIKDIICNNDSNGELKARIFIDAQEETDLTNYNFTWSNDPNLKASFQQDLPPATYSVTVRDNLGCVATPALKTLTNPSKITFTQVSLVKATCSGVADGEVTISVNGGIKLPSGYTLKWADQASFFQETSSLRTNLLPGTYSISMEDARGCQKTAPVIIDAVKKLDFDITGVDASCLGKCDGKAIIVVASSATGTPGWEITNDGINLPVISGSGINYQFSGLCSGSYNVTMLSSEAGKQCSFEKTVVINDPDVLKIDTITYTQESCTAGGGKDGKIKVAAKGGVIPYAYNWASTTTSNLSDSSAVVNLTKGTYTVTVKDGAGCVVPFAFDITSRTPPKITELNTAFVSCIGNTDGKLSVKATAGDSPISTYTWSNGVSGQFLNALSVGSYKVTVTGSDGCSVDSSVQVLNPDPFKLSDTKTFEPTCVGKADGRIVITPAGGTAPYKITWENSTQTGTSLINIGKGTYRFNLVDANNCPTFSQNIVLADAPEILITMSGLTEVSCYTGTQDGKATATASYSDGKVGTFDFEWSSGESQAASTSATAIKLRSNLNTLTVTDNNLCKKIESVNIPLPPVIFANATVKPVTCFGLGDGVVDLAPTGGRGTFTFVWNTGSTSSSIKNMKNGDYTVTITDGNKCTLQEKVTITEPAQLLITLDTKNTKNVSCPGLSDGVLVFKLSNETGINPLGATPYQWSTDAGVASSSNSKDKLPAGTYRITVTDSKGCQDQTQHIFTTPDPIIAFFNPVNPPLCYGTTTTLSVKSVSGGNGLKLSDYVFSVNNSGISFPVDQNIQIFAGRTIIQVEDYLGCAYTETIDVSSPLPLLVEFNPGSINIPLGDTSTQLKPAIQTSNPIKTYKWTPSAGLSSSSIVNPTIRDLYGDQKFNLEVTDINGCKSNGNIQVLVDRNYSVFIPNVFSPNGDGINDELRIHSCLGVKEVTNFRIFDRWGNLIKALNTVPIDCEGGTILWDGSYTTRAANVGSYVYTFEVLFLDGYKRPYSGDFVIIK
jgi:gliding motility-associated-like protein